jgi:hypothetical protein
LTAARLALRRRFARVALDDAQSARNDIERMPMGYESLVGGMGSKPPWP